MMVHREGNYRGPGKENAGPAQGKFLFKQYLLDVNPEKIIDIFN